MVVPSSLRWLGGLKAPNPKSLYRMIIGVVERIRCLDDRDKAFIGQVCRYIVDASVPFATSSI